MSLDVSLNRRLDNYNELSIEQKSYFHREYADYITWEGDELSFDEWFKENGTEEIFSANITHNLNTMADKARIYEALWRPEEIKAKQAKDIIPILEKGLKKLKEKPEYFKQFDAENGWGTYKDFIPWVENYLEACKEYPEAEIYVNR